MNDIIDLININRDRYVDELKEYLAIPSISALPEHAADVRTCAGWTAAQMKRVGLEHVRIIDTPGNPVVYADWLHAAGAPTILFYGHYDVQPVDPLELWESPPFEATIRAGEIYARGAADDKGQVFMHLKAVEALLRGSGRLPVNIKFILEGEEERSAASTWSRSSVTTRRSWRPTVGRDLRLADAGPRRALHLLRPARPDLPADRSARHGDRSALGVVRRGGGEPRLRTCAGAESDEGP